MIYIKIYGKGRDKTHIYTKVRCPREQLAVQLAALFMTTHQIAREATTALDKDEFLWTIDDAWDMKTKRSESG